MAEDTKNLDGLGGWLILVGIGVVLGLTSNAAEMASLFREVSNNAVRLELLTTPGTESYHPFWKVLLIGEMLGLGVNAMFSLLLIFLFFTKSKNFPKIFIGLLIFNVLFLLIEGVLGKIVMPNEPFFLHKDGMRSFARVVIGCLIWIPYMLVSKRVKATFTR